MLEWYIILSVLSISSALVVPIFAWCGLFLPFASKMFLVSLLLFVLSVAGIYYEVIIVI